MLLDLNMIGLQAKEWGVASRSWKRQGNGFSPRAFRKECGSIDTLMLAQLAQFWTFDLQNGKMINLYCLEPHSL